MHLSKARNIALFAPRGDISKSCVWSAALPLPLNSWIKVTGSSLHQQQQNIRYLHQSIPNHARDSYGSSPICKPRSKNIESSANLSVMDSSDHLPRLPIPPLETTLDRLKESISPVAMNSTEFVNTLHLIDAFSKSAGPKLDQMLRHKANQCSNWLTSDWWIPKYHLSVRKSIMINMNSSQIYPLFPFEVNNQRSLINFTSQLISSWIDYKLALDNGYNPEATSPDNEYRLDPNLCYQQYKHFFGSTRFPGEPIDSIVPGNLDCSSTGLLSFVISFRNRFFEVQLQDVENEKTRVDKIAVIIHKILDTVDLCDTNSEESLHNLPIGAGVLTATSRHDWAKSFDLIDQDAVRALKEAQFVVCLDSITDKSNSFSQPLRSAPQNSSEFLAALSRQILHSDSTNVGNRWFDKLQLVIVTDESASRLLGAGTNFEHTLTEGFAIPKLLEITYDRTVGKIRESSQANFFAKQVFSTETATFKQLKMFKEGSEVEVANALKSAMQDFNAHVGQFDLSYFIYKSYGKNSIKSWRLNPGSWVQVALVSAYYNLHKRLKAVYDSATTRKFALGRTEVVRSLTKEMAEYCLNPNYDTLTQAIKAHHTLRVEASNGIAIDRPLLGYKWTFDELKINSWPWGLPSSLSQSDGTRTKEFECDNQLDRIFSEKELSLISAFFNDELIQRTSRFALTIAQLPNSNPDTTMSMGPLMADGYAIAYSVTGQQIVATIAANSENQSFSCEIYEYERSLRESLDTIRVIVEEQRSLDK